MAVIDDIYGAGADALTYEFQVTFGPQADIDTVVDSLPLRVTNVNIPEISQGEYTVEYKTETLVKSNGKNTTPKEFDIEFRLDKNQNIYKAFKAWSAKFQNPSTGGYAEDTVATGLRTTIDVQSGYLDIDGVFVLTGLNWHFQGAWPKRVAAITLDNSGTDPILCAVTFGYLTMADPVTVA